MKLYLTALAITILSLFTAVAPADAQNVTGWVGFLPQYTVENGSQLYPKSVMQADLTVNLPVLRGCYADVWVEQSFDQQHHEVDRTLGCGGKYGDVNIAHFRIKPAGGEATNIVQSTIKAILPRENGNHSSAIYVAVNHIHAVDHPGRNSGTFIRIGGSDTWKLNDRLSIVNSGWLLHDSGVFQGERGLIARYEGGFARKLGSCTVQPTVRFSVPMGATRKDRKNQTVGVLKFIF